MSLLLLSSVPSVEFLSMVGRAHLRGFPSNRCLPSTSCPLLPEGSSPRLTQSCPISIPGKHQQLDDIMPGEKVLGCDMGATVDFSDSQLLTATLTSALRFWERWRKPSFIKVRKQGCVASADFLESVSFEAEAEVPKSIHSQSIPHVATDSDMLYLWGWTLSVSVWKQI